MMNFWKKQFINHVKHRGVNTWSPLATAFNSITKDNYGFELSKKESGLFGIPELKTAQGFSILKHQAMSETDMLIEEATSPNRKRKMVEIFDDMSDALCKVADLAEFIRIAHPEEQYVKAAEDACIFISGIVEKLNTHRDLYNALKQVVHNGDVQDTSILDNHVAKLFLFDFEQCGIHLPEAERETVVQLNDYILQVGQKFMADAGNPRAVDANILPPGAREHFAMKDNQIIVQGLYVDSSNNLIREAAYRVFLYPDKGQEYLLQELLNSRHDLARLCGFPSYAHRAVKGSTVETPEVVYDFLNILNDNLKFKAAQDFQQMQEMKDAESSTKQKIMQWDTAYFTAKAKRSWLKMSSSEFTPYFSLGACMDGINILTQSLYGIRLESTAISSGEVWANNIQKITVIDENNSVLGYIYCDFFERDGKPNQDCHFTIRGGRQLADGTYQVQDTLTRNNSEVTPPDLNETLGGYSSYSYLKYRSYNVLRKMPKYLNYNNLAKELCSPKISLRSEDTPIAVLMLSLPAPRWSNPCLLSPASVENLFHEMGHALHSMLGRTKYQHVTGTRCSTDFAEVPSILMEYFASDPRVVSTFARHFQTLEQIPNSLLEKLHASKNIFCASELQNQVCYSMLDQVYHSGKLEKSSTTILKEIQGKYYGLPYVENTAWHLRFSHLVGYGAKYYAYLISRAIASWIWQTYFQADPFNRTAGDRYRNECLAHGGGKPSSKLVSDFLNKEASANNFAKSLLNEIDIRTEQVKSVRDKVN